ncbi:MAG: TldD/PmbA family protein [Acidimicrobiia bacterium]
MIEHDVAGRVLAEATRLGADFAEVFAEDRRSNTTTLDDGRIEEFVTGRERGAGVRVQVGDTTGFAHTADLSEPALVEAARSAAAAARGGGDGARVVPLQAVAPVAHTIEVPVASVPKADKVAKLLAADDAARAAGDAVKQVSAWYADGTRRILVANTEGVLAEDATSRVRMFVNVTAAGDTGMQTGYEAPAYTMGWEYFDRVDPAAVAREAARKALVLLDAEPAPAGKWTVVLAKGAGGVLFHEACGHGLEADLVNRDASVFKDRVGTRVASPGVTLVDDGAFVSGWGTAGVDDEGTPMRRNVLVEDGYLVDYMWDSKRARKAGRAVSGNGRRETYRDLPMVRMTNTLLLPGAEDPDEIVAQTDKGIYVASLSGGQVNTATGDFVFGMSEAYLIEGGRITRPIRSANLIGNGPEVLSNIDAIGSDFDTWPGTCGKDGQGVPVTAGQPTLRVNGVTVGGTAS